MIMSNELFWLALTVAMTGLFWVPYILDRIMVRGLMGALANPSLTDKAQSPLGATPHGGARQCGRKPDHFRAACFDGAGAEHHDGRDRFRVRALFLVTACACRGLYARHSSASYAFLCRRFRCPGATGAGDFLDAVDLRTT